MTVSTARRVWSTTVMDAPPWLVMYSLDERALGAGRWALGAGRWALDEVAAVAPACASASRATKLVAANAATSAARFMALRHDLAWRIANHEETLADAHHADRSVLEERIVVPRALEARRILARVRVEESDFLR